MKKTAFIVFSILLCSAVLKAQLSFSGYVDAGTSNVSEGLFIKTASSGSYKFGKTEFKGGVQLDILSQASYILSAFRIDITREFRVKELPLHARGFYFHNRFSELMAENNAALLCNISLEHFSFSLGTNFRTYGVTRYAAGEYNIDRQNRIHENWNLIYLVSYSLYPADHEWNVSLSVTNFDHFMIEQETNPGLFLRGQYDVSTPLTLFAESWYKTAGSFNLSVNYFGFFFRTGLIWDINL
ncbi:MAG: hypothetical protein KFF49_03755 [Bacteroidales bacterium]|nr:hypothetical protein [Bacteroidales bacterium]